MEANWKKTVNKVARILKPRGIAYFETTNAIYPFPRKVKYLPWLGYIPPRHRQRIIGMIITRFPNLDGYSITPAQYWFTQIGLRKALSIAGFEQSRDIFDLINRQDIPLRFRFASCLLFLIKNYPIRILETLPTFPTHLSCSYAKNR